MFMFELRFAFKTKICTYSFAMKSNIRFNPNLCGGGYFYPPVGCPLITQKR